MILNEKEKIELHILNRKDIVIYSRYNKGIENYKNWLERKNNCKVKVEEFENMTHIKSELDLKIVSPGSLC